VALDVSSPLLHLDEHRLPMHGVPWPLLRWEPIDAGEDFVSARLEWSADNLLAIFPFPHRMEMTASISPGGLSLETTLVASSEGAVPVSFGFHPYISLKGISRANWRLELPAMRKLVLDKVGIPTGDEEPFPGLNAQLGDSSFDDGFALLEERASFSVTGAARKVSYDFLEGYRYTQVFAPKDKDFIAIEPMTAPTSALTSGRGLRIASPGERFRTLFRISVDESES
jgi:galactose mutarotase-like enzyme